MSQAIRITIKDGLGFPSGFVHPASYTCVLYLRAPDNWLREDGLLLADKAELILENMYGKTWRRGNEDGSYYAILDIEAAPLSAEEEAQQVWMQSKVKDPNYQYWLYHVSDAEVFTQVDADNF